MGACSFPARIPDVAGPATISGRDLMSSINRLHDAVKGGDLPALTALLAADPKLANARSESHPRGTFPLPVAAEVGQVGAAKLLLAHGADVSLLDSENAANALCWAAFFGRPE